MAFGDPSDVGLSTLLGEAEAEAPWSVGSFWISDTWTC